ncbi:MAG TPA: hypothetical protein VL988_12795 [Solirubrobacteraceae bacterium]|nr:hypothetical protein [Solirubrobacteraceae bacterium]
MSARAPSSGEGPSAARYELIRWVAGLGAVTAEALAWREGVTVASARARLTAAVRAGQLARHRPLTDEPALYVLTRAGVRVLSLDGFESSRVSAANARHMVASAHAAALLQRLYPDHELIGEPALRRAERIAGARIASVSLSGLGRGVAPGEPGRRAVRTHRPDLVLLPRAARGGRPVAVEVELTVKAPRRLEAICRAWARARHVDGALYLTAPGVERALARAIEAAHANERVAAVSLGSLLKSGV